MLAPHKTNRATGTRSDKAFRKLRRQDLLELLLEQMRSSDEQRQLIESQASQIEEQNALIEKLKGRLDEKDAQIEHLKDRLNMKDDQLGELDMQARALAHPSGLMSLDELLEVQRHAIVQHLEELEQERLAAEAAEAAAREAEEAAAREAEEAAAREAEAEAAESADEAPSADVADEASAVITNDTTADEPEPEPDQAPLSPADNDQTPEDAEPGEELLSAAEATYETQETVSPAPEPAAAPDPDPASPSPTEGGDLA